MFEKQSFSRIGLIAAIIMTVGYFVLTFLIGMDPSGFSMERTMENFDYIPDLSITATWKLLFAFLGIIQTGYILSLVAHQLIDSKKYQAQIIYFAIIGITACIMTSVNWLNSRDMMFQIANGIENFGVDPGWIISSAIDPNYFWSFGMLGVFYLFFGIITVLTKTFTKGIRIVSLILGTCSLLIHLFVFFKVLIPINGTGGFKLFFPLAGLCCGVLAPLLSILSIRYFTKSLKA